MVSLSSMLSLFLTIFLLFYLPIQRRQEAVQQESSKVSKIVALLYDCNR